MSAAGPSAQVEELRLAVELPTDVAERAGDEVCDAVRIAVEEIVAALGIPAAPTVTVETASADGEVGPFRIRIGDERYAHATAVVTGEEADVEALTEAAASTIAANRELLLTPPIAARLIEAWNARSGLVASAGLSADALSSVFVDLVRRCMNVAPRPLDGPPHEPVDSRPRTDTPDALREAIVESRNDASFTAFVEPELATAPQRPDDYDLAETGALLQELFVDELGVVLPTVSFQADPGLAAGRFRFRVNDLTFPPQRGLLANEVLVLARAEDVAARGVAVVRKGTNPTTEGEAAIVVVDEAARAELSAANFFLVEPRTYVVFAARRALRRAAGSFLLPDVLMFALNRLREDDAAIVDAALARFDRYLLTAVIRRLLDEQIPIRNTVGILEGMLAIGSSMSIDQSRYDVFAADTASIWSVQDVAGPAFPEAADYAECVRRHLRWHVTRELVDNDGRIQAFMIDRQLESRLRTPSQPLDESERLRLRHAVWSVYEPFASAGTGVVAVTNSEVRHVLRRLLEPEFPELHVLSRHEIAPETEIRWNGEIAWA